MRFTSAFVLAMLAGASALAATPPCPEPPQAPAATGATVRGRLVVQDGKPLPAVVVTAKLPIGLPVAAESGPDGVFVLRDLPAGSTNFTFALPQGLVATPRTELSWGGPWDVERGSTVLLEAGDAYDFGTLEVGQRGYGVRARVSCGGNPVPGATVRLWRAGAFWMGAPLALTDEQGRGELWVAHGDPGAACWVYAVRAGDDSFECSAPARITPRAWEWCEVEVAFPSKRRDVALEVYDSSGAPLPGARVLLLPPPDVASWSLHRTAVTSARGTCGLNGLGNQPCRIAILPPGRAWVVRDLTDPSASDARLRVQVPAGRDISLQVDLRLGDTELRRYAAGVASRSPGRALPLGVFLMEPGREAPVTGIPIATFDADAGPTTILLRGVPIGQWRILICPNFAAGQDESPLPAESIEARVPVVASGPPEGSVIRARSPAAWLSEPVPVVEGPGAQAVALPLAPGWGEAARAAMRLPPYERISTETLAASVRFFAALARPTREDR